MAVRRKLLLVKLLRVEAKDCGLVGDGGAWLGVRTGKPLGRDSEISSRGSLVLVVDGEGEGGTGY